VAAAAAESRAAVSAEAARQAAAECEGWWEALQSFHDRTRALLRDPLTTDMEAVAAADVAASGGGGGDRPLQLASSYNAALVEVVARRAVALAAQREVDDASRAAVQRRQSASALTERYERLVAAVRQLMAHGSGGGDGDGAAAANAAGLGGPAGLLPQLPALMGWVRRALAALTSSEERWEVAEAAAGAGGPPSREAVRQVLMGASQAAAAAVAEDFEATGEVFKLCADLARLT
jgi:hypothetical protein